jgi:hypothetical protein
MGDRPHLILASAAEQHPPAALFARVSPPVLHTLRALRRVREEHMREFSPLQRRELAAAERLTAQYIDLQAQLDAADGEEMGD